MSKHGRLPGRARRTLAGAVVLALVGTGGCESLLEVDLPTRLPAAALDDARLANVLVLGAIADFECAFTNYVAATGTLTDELQGSTGWIAPTMWDQRRIFPENGNLGSSSCTALGWGVFRPLSTAVFQANDAFRRITDFPDADVPDKARLLATAAAYAGYGLTILGEAFCEVTVELSPIRTPAEVLGMAEERFTAALELGQQAGASDIVNMARVGRARVRLDLRKTAEAAADAREVPEGFVQEATYSATAERRWNRVAVDMHELFYVVVHPSFRDLDVDGVPDSRVPTEPRPFNGHDGVIPVVVTAKYTSNSDPIALASWKEAQLIIAEAEGGQAAVDAINRLRGRAGLPLFASSDPAAIAAQVAEERRRELYLEGHRLNDMLRLELSWEEGTTNKGIAFGPTRCLPLPTVERLNNPNIAG